MFVGLWEGWVDVAKRISLNNKLVVSVFLFSFDLDFAFCCVQVFLYAKSYELCYNDKEVHYTRIYRPVGPKPKKGLCFCPCLSVCRQMTTVARLSCHVTGQNYFP